MKRIRTALSCLPGLTPIAIAPLQAQQLAMKKAVTLEFGKRIGALAEKTTIANNFHIFISVMRDGCNLMVLLLLGNTTTMVTRYLLRPIEVTRDAQEPQIS